ncbi:PVC-type heme-binding CxxCH protein [Negadavirga shengliensis]|uniref:PVC-type heme-binding CxxCH protein n=1 Tax=Negadavirga shengliensis TaxID=1389218 RepID=A0ABV9T8S8_9BACT
MKIDLIPKITIGLLIAFSYSCQQPKQVTSEVNLPESRPSTYVEEEPDPIYAEHVRSTDFQTPEEEMADFILPPEFEVTLFASEPDITKPINIAFDERGRLWVSHSSEYPIKAGPGEGTDRISILEDTNGDGKADKITPFADDLNIPIGILPVKEGAIGFSIPNIYRFYDTDGDGKADRREVLLGEFETKDTHGMVNNLFRGLDGWVHASHGFSNISVVAGSDGDSVKMVSGNTFRFKMDGSRIEKTSDGRINPFGSDLDELGYHYSADCHTLPIYQLIGGGNYTQWGKKEPNMGFAPTMMDYGLNSTALSGLVYYTDNQFPEEYRNSFYSGDVVTCRISRSTMEFNGSTPWATRQEDFLVSKDPWFRPVDIKIGPDGAMYVADFYNRIIGHYEVPLDHPGRDRVSGRIWKITYKGNEREVTDWSKASMPKLIDGLNHQVLHMRMTATDELVDRYGKEAIPSLEKIVRLRKTGSRQLVQALWALHRLEALPDQELEKALNHPDMLVRVHAYRILANYPKLDANKRAWALKGLEDKDPHVKRVAAETLVKHPDAGSFKKLVEWYHNTPEQDTHLKYALMLAFSEHIKDENIARQAAEERWNEKEASFVAMVLSDTDLEVAGEFLLEHLKKHQEPEKKTLAYLTSIARTIPSGKLAEAIHFAKNRRQGAPHLRALALNQGIEQRGEALPSSLREWNMQLTKDILAAVDHKEKGWTDEEKSAMRFASEAAAKFRMAEVKEPLRKLVSYNFLDEDNRALAANALMEIDPKGQLDFLAGIMGNADYTTSLRQKVAQAIGNSPSKGAKEKLGEGMKAAPMELQETIAGIFVKTSEGKDRILEYIRQGYAPARVLKARSIEENFLSRATDKQVEEFEALTANLMPVSEERQTLIAERIAQFESNGASISSGRTLYEQHCSMCHQIDNKGGLIGPQLDGIGNWGLQALATKVLDPNRNITENFRTYTITLKNGQTRSGLYRREEGQVLVMADQTGKEFTVSKQDIAEQSASKITLMPDYFSTTLGQEQFNELMAYLLNVR